MNYKIILFAALLIALIGLERTYSFQNGGFCTSKLISNLPPLLNPPPTEIDALLDQSFCFLGRGGTSFVFLGEDGTTVLKLFKHQHLLQKSLLFRIAFPGMTDALRMGKLLNRKKKHAHKHQAFFFNSCQLAYSKLKEETGLLYLCLQPNPHFAKPIHLIDAWGFSHTVDLRKTEFALQKKAELLFPYFEKLLQSGDKRQARLAIDALIKQMQSRCSQGIGDRDPNLLINFGYIDEEAIEVDIGSYYLNPSLTYPLASAKEIFFSTHALQQWLEERSPELLEYLLERLQPK